MLYREIIAVRSQIHTKHINTLCGENVELLNVTVNGTCNDHWALEGTRCRSHHQSAGLPVTGRCQSVATPRHAISQRCAC